MNILMSRFSFAIIALALSSCERPETAQKLAEIEEKISGVEKRLKAQEDQNRSITDQVTFLIQQPFKEKTVELDPNAKGYAVLDTGRGPLLFACDGAEPYLDGHRINIRIGNPLNMRFSGFKLKFTFGSKPRELPTEQNTSKENLENARKKWAEWMVNEREAWSASLRHIEESFFEDLPPGTWTSVKATLPQTKPEDIAYIQVAIQTDSISLTKQ